MDFMIFDSSGNAIAALDDASAAYATMRALCKVEPEAADEYALFTYDEQGHVVGEPMMMFDLPAEATVNDFASFVIHGDATGAIGKSSRTVPKSAIATWAPTFSSAPQPQAA